MQKILPILLLTIQYSFSQHLPTSYYIPADVSYDTAISTPEEILGHEVGEFHVSHDKLVYYLAHLAKQSDRIEIETYGYTHEKRPLLLLTISAPINISKLPTIREERAKIIETKNLDTTQLSSVPLVVWLGYSIHGNEPSGSNAALLLAYYLAAAQGEKIDQLLNSTVILIDPCANPDGLQRYAGWANANRSKNPVGDLNNREYNEPWPQGRTNHYWFDLNRDWLLLQQPESKARLIKFHEWKPNVVTDHHEMGINSTLFFQPGVPGRKHPLTPAMNEKLMETLATYHIKVLDKQKELYFTRESFDDFYYGKGASYPDLNGAIGILFEQASTRGMVRETDNGLRHFASSIKNQLTISLSTLEGSFGMKNKLLSYQNEFYQGALDAASKNVDKAYIFGNANDPVKVNILAQLLMDHQINIYKPTDRIKVNNKTFNPESSYIIPLVQDQYLLIKALFEKRTKFKDSLFYDVSSWSMDLAFNLHFETLNTRNISNHLTGKKITSIEQPMGALSWKSKYAYAMRWDQHYAPLILYQLLAKGIKVKVSESEFIDARGNTFPNGSLVVPLGIQEKSEDFIFNLLDSLTNTYPIAVHPLESGTNAVGIDLGSPQLVALKIPKILIVAGEGVNANEAGEIWHLLDQKIDIPVTLVPADRLDGAKLDRYTTIIFPDGNYNTIGNSEKLKTWINNGGILIAQNDALRWLKNNGIFLGNFKPLESPEILEISYHQRTQYKGAHSLGGAIFQTNIDTSHPLCFGYEDQQLAVFKNNKIWLDQSFMKFNNPILFTDKPLLAGYISSKNLSYLKNTSAVTVHAYGEGKVIGFAINPNFRGSWYGTERLFLNGIFFGQMIKTQL